MPANATRSGSRNNRGKRAGCLATSVRIGKSLCRPGNRAAEVIGLHYCYILSSDTGNTGRPIPCYPSLFPPRLQSTPENHCGWYISTILSCPVHAGGQQCCLAAFSYKDHDKAGRVEYYVATDNTIRGTHGVWFSHTLLLEAPTRARRPVTEGSQTGIVLS